MSWSVFDDILNLKTLYRGTRKPSSIREGLFDLFGRGEINESEQIPETVYFYTWERPYPTEQWGRHNADYECSCDECKKYAFNYGFDNSKVTGLIRSNQFKPEWEETPAGSEVVRVLFIPHMRGINTPTVYRGITRQNLDLSRYGFEPVIWSDSNSKNPNGEFYSSPYNTNLRALEQRLGRNVGRTLNYPRFSSETVTKYSESFKGESGPSYLYGSYHYDHSLQDLYEHFEMYYGPDDTYGISNASPGYEAGPAGGSGRWAIINAFNTGVLREVPAPRS